jgi:hypothetical protein
MHLPAFATFLLAAAFESSSRRTVDGGPLVSSGSYYCEVTGRPPQR